MSVVIKKSVGNITDEYIRENIDEILEIMLYITNDYPSIVTGKHS